MSAHVDERGPMLALEYPGDVRNSFHAYRPLGPSQTRRWLWPVEAEFDEEAGRTRVGVSTDTPAGVCNGCYCTDDRACAGGCTWVEPNLCSRCAGDTSTATDVENDDPDDSALIGALRVALGDALAARRGPARRPQSFGLPRPGEPSPGAPPSRSLLPAEEGTHRFFGKPYHWHLNGDQLRMAPGAVESRDGCPGCRQKLDGGPL